MSKTVTVPEVPAGLEQDLQLGHITVKYLDGDKIREVICYRDYYSYGNDDAHLELAPHLVVASEEIRSNDRVEVMLTRIRLSSVIEITVKAEPEYGDIVPVSVWHRMPADGKLVRFYPQAKATTDK